MAVQLTVAPAGARRANRGRPMRNTRLVSLRSSLPTGLVTIRHDVPEHLTGPIEATLENNQQEATPKVEAATRVSTRIRVETAAGKGVTAR